MTRRFDSYTRCPYCKESHTAETPFEAWMRNHEKLDSRLEGIVRFDCDVLLHRYKTRPPDKKSQARAALGECRMVQCMMFIEVKSHLAELSDAQRDTLGLFSQVLKNQRTNIHGLKGGRRALNHRAPLTVYSYHLGKRVQLRLYGGHLLQIEGDVPEAGKVIRWDNKPITLDQLVQLLRFEIEPDGLRPIDWRRRWSDFSGIERQKLLLPFDQEPGS